jgi:hypothetical protein
MKDEYISFLFFGHSKKLKKFIADEAGQFRGRWGVLIP